LFYSNFVLFCFTIWWCLVCADLFGFCDPEFVVHTWSGRLISYPETYSDETICTAPDWAWHCHILCWTVQCLSTISRTHLFHFASHNGITKKDVTLLQ
jgi:hypothetical protein